MKYTDNKELVENEVYVFEYPQVSFIGRLDYKTSYWTHKECKTLQFINMDTGVRGADAKFYSYNEVRDASKAELSYYEDMLKYDKEVKFKNYKNKSDYEIY